MLLVSDAVYLELASSPRLESEASKSWHIRKFYFEEVVHFCSASPSLAKLTSGSASIGCS